MKKYIVGGAFVHSLTMNELAEQAVIDSTLNGRSGLPKLVFSMNGEGVSAYNRKSDFKSFVDQADLVHADGMSVVLAGRHLAKGEFPERVATTDAFHNVAKHAEQAGLSFYFLGAKKEVNQAAVENVKLLYPKLRIAGSHHGYFSDTENDMIINDILESKADIVWVALGRPRQEEWCVNNRQSLKGVTWLKTCGGLFDFLAGEKPRAPLWMQKYCLEWFFRLRLEPRRLFKRYVFTNFHSIYCFLSQRKVPAFASTGLPGSNPTEDHNVL